jgi:hypothetical protein
VETRHYARVSKLENNTTQRARLKTGKEPPVLRASKEITRPTAPSKTLPSAPTRAWLPLRRGVVSLLKPCCVSGYW